MKNKRHDNPLKTIHLPVVLSIKVFSVSKREAEEAQSKRSRYVRR